VKRLFIILTVLLVLGNVGLLFRSWWTNKLWEQAMYGMATYAGAMQADADFRHGVLRLYELSPDAKSEDAHRKEGLDNTLNTTNCGRFEYFFIASSAEKARNHA